MARGTYAMEGPYECSNGITSSEKMINKTTVTKDAASKESVARFWVIHGYISSFMLN